MSRLGKKPIEIPEGVTVKFVDNEIIVKGPLGELKQKLHKAVNVEVEGKNVKITVENPEEKKNKEQWGLASSLVKNMLLGVKTGFEKKLEINGVGYKAAVSGEKLVLNLGFSHPYDFVIPKGIKILVEKNIVTISGFDKQLVGEVAAQIRKIRKPEPYKGKGIKYSDEVIRRKAGKVVKGAGA